MARGRKKNSTSSNSNMYFGETEELVFAKYLVSTDEEEKEKLFNTFLKPAFTKMIESIIRRYKLFTPDEEYQETFDDTFSFLMTKIEKFNPNGGWKAYSFCGTVCKNYLLYKINQCKKRRDRTTEYNPALGDNERYSYDPQCDDKEFLGLLFKEIVKMINEMISNPEKHRLKPNDLKVGEGLIRFLEEWDDNIVRMGSDKFNKNAVILYIQEMTLLIPDEIKASLKKYKTAYKRLKSKIADVYY